MVDDGASPTPPTYRIVVNGARATSRLTQTIDDIASRLSATPDEIRRMLASSNYVLKSGLTSEEAENYLSVLTDCHVIAGIENESEILRFDLPQGPVDAESSDKKRIKGFNLLVGAAIVMAIGFALAAYRHLDEKFTSRPEQMSAPQLAGGSSHDITGQPTDEVDFIMAIRRAKRQFAVGANDMQKGASRPTRAREICAALPSFQIQNWVGTIEKLTSNGEGKGVVKIKIDEAVFVKTWNNSLSDIGSETFSDIGSETLIDPASPLFNKVSVLEKGQKVLFSGSFFHKDTDCVEEPSLTLEGSITSPEFIMKFSDISVFSKQASLAPIKKITPDTSTLPGTLAEPAPAPEPTPPLASPAPAPAASPGAPAPPPPVLQVPRESEAPSGSAPQLLPENAPTSPSTPDQPPPKTDQWEEFQLAPKPKDSNVFDEFGKPTPKLVQPEAGIACPPRDTLENAQAWVHERLKCERHPTPNDPWIEWAEYCPSGPLGYFVLKVRTGQQKVYLFENIPPAVWEGFKAAPSAGKFYHSEIKGKRHWFRLGLKPSAPELCHR